MIVDVTSFVERQKEADASYTQKDMLLNASKFANSITIFNLNDERQQRKVRSQ